MFPGGLVRAAGAQARDAGVFLLRPVDERLVQFSSNSIATIFLVDSDSLEPCHVRSLKNGVGNANCLSLHCCDYESAFRVCEPLVPDQRQIIMPGPDCLADF